MWQLGIALASVASLSGAVGDALVRLSFVVEEKRLTSHRREANRRQKGGNEEEAEGAKGAIPSEKARVGEAEGARSSRAKKKTIFSLQEPASRSSPDRSRTSSDVFRGSEGRERGGDKRGTVQHAEDRKATHSLNAGSSTGKRPLYLRPLWLIGMCLGTVINSLLSIVSLDFASAAVITPFAGLHIFWNVILSRFVLQERVLLQHYVGSALILLGLLLVLCFGVHTPPPLSLEQLLQLYSQNTCLLYFSASILGIAFCVYVAIVGRDCSENASFSASATSHAPTRRKNGALELHVLASRFSFSSSPQPSACSVRSEPDSEKTSRPSCPPSAVPRSVVCLPLDASPNGVLHPAPPPLPSFPPSPPPSSLPALGERQPRALLWEAEREREFSEREKEPDRSGEDPRSETSRQFPPRQPREAGDCLAPRGNGFPLAHATAGSEGERSAGKSRLGESQDDTHSPETSSARELCALVPASALTAKYRGREKEGYLRTVEQCRKLVKPGSVLNDENQVVSSHLRFPAPFRRFCTAAVSGLCGGNTNVLMEHVMKVWHEETWGHLCHYKFFTLLFLLGSMAVAQLLFLNVGLARYEALYVVPTTMSVLIVSSCFAEIALFINVLHLPQTEILLFAGGCFSIVVGIMILSGASVERREADRAGAGGGAPVDVEGDDFSAVDASRSLRPTTRHNCTFVLERSPQQFENAFAALEMQADAPGTARRLALSSSPPGPGSSYPLPLGEEAADARGETPEAAGDQTGIACRTRQEGERKQAREGLTAGETERSRTETSRSSPNRRRKGHGYAFLTGEPPLSEEDGREASRQASEMSTRAVSSASLETRSYSESRPEAEGNHVDASPSPFSTRDRKWENPHLLLAVSNTLREYAEHRDAARGVSADEARHADSGFCEEFDFARERRGERGNSAESDSGNSRESESPPSTPDLLEKNLLYRRGRGEKEGESERRLLERTSGTVLASRPARMQEVNICFVDEGDGDATYERRFLTPAGAAEAAHSAAREKAGRDTRNRSNVMEDQNGKLET
uniref:Magnesium transporter NIPA n=1 Tax=Neospora caninum (strain Liverpool) TaxID=572307 RepID=A0A0F7UMA8_NEOCL|nr:TPA: hypothetical protein BN1204_058130 [Neospora caninum Liverpool]